MTHQEPLQRAIDICGSQAALGEKIGRKQAHIWFWLHRAKTIPARAAIDIETATEGRVKRHELCPDVFPSDENAGAA